MTSEKAAVVYPSAVFESAFSSDFITAGNHHYKLFIYLFLNFILKAHSCKNVNTGLQFPDIPIFYIQINGLIVLSTSRLPGCHQKATL